MRDIERCRFLGIHLSAGVVCGLMTKSSKVSKTLSNQTDTFWS